MSENAGDQDRRPGIQSQSSFMKTASERGRPSFISQAAARKAATGSTLDHEDEDYSWFVQKMVACPTGVACACLTVTLLFFVIMMSTLEAIDPPYFAETTEWDRFNMAEIATEATLENVPADPQTQEVWDYSFDMLFSGSDLFNKDKIGAMLEVQDYFLNSQEYTGRLCKVNVAQSLDCDMSEFWGLLPDWFRNDDTTQDMIDDYILSISNDDYPGFSIFNKDFEDTKPRVSQYKMRFPLAGPYPESVTSNTSEFLNIYDSVFSYPLDGFLEKQDKNWGDFSKDVMDDWLDKSVSGVDIYPWNMWIYNTIGNQVMMFALSILLPLAILLSLSYIIYNVSSCFIGGMGILTIILCMGPAFFIYRFIFQIESFSNYNSLVVFILLGIGADDLFVFNDAWIQSSHVYHETLDRMQFAFNRAASAMLVTSLTTAVAFFATGVSQIPFIRGFGLWAGLCVTFNYLYFISIVPCYLLIEHYYYQIKWCGFHLCCKCCGKCCEVKSHTEKEKEAELALKQKEEAISMGADSGDHEEEEYRAIENYFKNTHTNFVVRFKFPILAFFVALWVGGVIAISFLEPPSEQEEFYMDRTSVAKLEDQTTKYYEGAASGVAQPLVWGLDGLDKSDSCWNFYTDDAGCIKWDDNFDLSPAANQEWLYNLCGDLYNFTTPDLVQQPDTAANIECFIMDFKTYMGGDFTDYANKAELSADLRSFVDDANYAHWESGGYVNFLDGELVWIQIMFTTTLSWSHSNQENEDVMNAVHDWIDDLAADAPDGMKNMIAPNFIFAWVETASEYIRGAVSGVGLAIGIAFCVLLFFTLNIIISFFAVFDILGVLGGVGIMMKICGFDIGISEAISFVVMIGFSVDYVVHLGHSYLECSKDDREHRLGYALLSMGISIVGGCISTLLCSIPLMFSSTWFFLKMGLYIFSVIFWSFLWAMFFFPALLAWIGPQGGTGDLHPYLQFCGKPCGLDKYCVDHHGHHAVEEEKTTELATEKHDAL